MQITALTRLQGGYPFPQRDGVVPTSDAAGEVVAVGSKVKIWKEGDKVLTLFNQGHLAGAVDQVSLGGGVGGMVDGGLQQYGVFNEYGVVRQPSNLNDVESASLCCAGLTAWNALYGVEGKKLMPGQWVLTQGTGGVSIFAVQFAKAAGARVIATTSSKDKMDKLKKLGADHVINYKEDQNWGETAKKLTGGVGVDHVIEVGGPSTTRNSLKAIKFEGIISIIGFIGGFKEEKPPVLVDALMHICTVRGILVGSRAQLEDMCLAVEANNIKPVIDQTFPLEKAKEAYQHQWDQGHFGKVGISIE